MKRPGFLKRLAMGAAALPFVSALSSPILTESESAVAEGQWLRFIRPDGSFWNGLFKASETTTERLESLRGLVSVAQYEVNGVVTRAYPLEALIAEWGRYGL